MSDVGTQAAPVLSRVSMMPNAPFMVPASWVDSLSLAANTALSYTLPLDSKGRPATLLRLSGDFEKPNAAPDLFFNCYGTAVVPTATVTNGSSSIEAVPPLYVLPVPPGVTSISFIATVAGVLVIEAWGR